MLAIVLVGGILIGMELQSAVPALVVEKEEGSAGILHSDRFVLVDDTGRIRGYYDGTDPDAVDEMIRAAKGLLKTL